MNRPFDHVPPAPAGPAPVDPAGAQLDEPPELDPAADTDDADTTGVAAGNEALDPDVRNGDLADDAADADEIATTSDPDPADEDGDFPGRPLTDDEIAALPHDDDA